MPQNTIDLRALGPPPGERVALYDDGVHAVYWLGIESKSAFRCNVYLIVDGEESIIFDPGGAAAFEAVRDRAAPLLGPGGLSAMVLSHQDPDVAASMVDWLGLWPRAKVITSPRTRVLVDHYGRAEYDFVDAEARPHHVLGSGSRLRFIGAPFLHFPGAIATYDERSRFLISGDIWAALSLDWSLVVRDFEAHIPGMNLFHLDYMASNVAARGFATKLDGLSIDALLPQHGSILGPEHVRPAVEYLRELQCGLDLIYF